MRERKYMGAFRYEKGEEGRNGGMEGGSDQGGRAGGEGGGGGRKPPGGSMGDSSYAVASGSME